MRSDVKKRLKNSVQKRLKRKRKVRVLGMSEVLEYLMNVEESLTLSDPDGIVE